MELDENSRVIPLHRHPLVLSKHFATWERTRRRS